MTGGEGYFLYHSIGMYPGKADDMAAGLAAFAATWGDPDAEHWGTALTLRQRFIDRWRAILGAAPGTVTTCENVTSGFASLFGGLPRERLQGKRVLVAADCFPSLHFLLAGLAPRIGFTLDTVPLRQGAAYVEPEDFLDAWGADVGLALLTWVSSTSSHRLDLGPLVDHGRRMGSVIGTDITQGAGLLPYDVMAPAVDFTVSTSLKWMCGTPGAGVLYVAPHLIPDCAPDLRGWFSQDDVFSWALDRFAFAPDIRRFDNGTPGTVAAIGSLPALDWHAGQDTAAMLAHNRMLTARLIAALDDMRLPIATPRDPARRGGSVMVRLPDRLPAAEVLARLAAAGVAADARGQMLRLSPGVMTTMAGTDRVIGVLQSQA